METKIDLFKVPVSALQSRTKEELSSRLNEKKILCSPDKSYQRDFRGLADCMGLKPMWTPDNDHVKRLIHVWSTRNLDEANLGKLCEFSRHIDRFDVLEDIQDCLDDDANLYLTQPPAPELVLFGNDFFPLSDQEKFDACVLYVNADRNFAQMILNGIEAAHLRVCDKNRNLLPGENELRAIYRLIGHQCRTLIVVFSDELLQDEIFMNVFYFAWHLSNKSDAFLKRVIPCVYKKCILPQDILSLVRLDFTRYTDMEFMNRLCRSIALPTNANYSDSRYSPNATSSAAPCKIQKVTNEELELTLLSEISDSESDDLNRALPEPRPLSKRIRSAITRLFAPRKRRKHA